MTTETEVTVTVLTESFEAAHERVERSLDDEIGAIEGRYYWKGLCHLTLFAHSSNVLSTSLVCR